MACRTFTVRGKRRLLAASVKLMAELAVNSGADDLGHLSLCAQMKLVREVKQYGARLVVIWKVAQFRQLILHDFRVTDRAEFRLGRLSFKPLLVTGCAGFVARPGHGCIRFARLMTIDALRSELQVLTMTEDQGRLRRGLGGGRAAGDPG